MGQFRSRIREQPLAETAHHEAGHFVARHYLTRWAEVHLVTIEPRGDILGEVVGEDPADRASDVERLEACIIGDFAGRAAQLRFAPRSATRATSNSRDDDEVAGKTLNRLDLSPEQVRAREQQLRKRATEFIEKHWPEVTALAAELLGAKIVDGELAELIIRAAAGDPNAAPELQYWRERVKNPGHGPKS